MIKVNLACVGGGRERRIEHICTSSKFSVFSDVKCPALIWQGTLWITLFSCITEQVQWLHSTSAISCLLLIDVMLTPIAYKCQDLPVWHDNHYNLLSVPQAYASAAVSRQCSFVHKRLGRIRQHFSNKASPMNVATENTSPVDDAQQQTTILGVGHMPRAQWLHRISAAGYTSLSTRGMHVAPTRERQNAHPHETVHHYQNHAAFKTTNFKLKIPKLNLPFQRPRAQTMPPRNISHDPMRHKLTRHKSETSLHPTSNVPPFASQPTRSITDTQLTRMSAIHEEDELTQDIDDGRHMRSSGQVASRKSLFSIDRESTDDETYHSARSSLSKASTGENTSTSSIFTFRGLDVSQCCGSFFFLSTCFFI